MWLIFRQVAYFYLPWRVKFGGVKPPKLGLFLKKIWLILADFPNTGWEKYSSESQTLIFFNKLKLLKKSLVFEVKAKCVFHTIYNSCRYCHKQNFIQIRPLVQKLWPLICNFGNFGNWKLMAITFKPVVQFDEIFRVAIHICSPSGLFAKVTLL